MSYNFCYAISVDDLVRPNSTENIRWYLISSPMGSAIWYPGISSS